MKWSNTLKQFVGKWLTDYLSLVDHFVKLALKGLALLYFHGLAFSVQVEPETHVSLLEVLAPEYLRLF